MLIFLFNIQNISNILSLPRYVSVVGLQDTFINSSFCFFCKTYVYKKKTSQNIFFVCCLEIVGSSVYLLIYLLSKEHFA